MRKNSADYLEMLFENRNKTYGAYDLRVNYENRLIKSFGMAMLIAGFFFLIPFVLTKVLKQTKHVEDEIITLCNMPREFTFEKEKPVATPMRPKPKVQASDSYKIEKKE